jgi:hypothetical protein
MESSTLRRDTAWEMSEENVEIVRRGLEAWNRQGLTTWLAFFTPRRKLTGLVRGVGIGATIADIQNAYPSAIVDHSTEQTFKLTLVRIPGNGDGRIQFAVPLSTHRVSLIGVPFIAFCE